MRWLSNVLPRNIHRAHERWLLLQEAKRASHYLTHDQMIARYGNRTVPPDTDTEISPLERWLTTDTLRDDLAAAGRGVINTTARNRWNQIVREEIAKRDTDLEIINDK